MTPTQMGTAGPVPWIVWALAAAVVLVVTVVRLRKGGPGPSVGWLPKFLSPWANRLFERRRWPVPYDDNLKKVPRWRRW